MIESLTLPGKIRRTKTKNIGTNTTTKIDEASVPPIIEIPKALVEDEITVLRKQAMERYAKEMDPENLPELPAELFKEQAEKRVKVGFLLGEVINVNELTVNQEKVAGLIESAASAYDNPAEVIEYYKNNKEMMQNMENVALEEQAVDFIIEKAKVTEVKKSFDEVMNKVVD